MKHNYIFSNINEALPALAKEVMKGDEVGSRAGRTKELIHVGVTLTRPQERETINPFRRGSIAAQIAETAWVLAGRDDVDWLSNYLPRAKDFSDDGKTWRGAYGKRIRAWERRDGSGDVIDQLRWLVEHLDADPSSRRAVINLFDPVLDQRPGKDIPCNDWLDFKSRLGYLDLHVALRSNDLIWGWSGINAFEWSVLQEVVATMLGVTPGVLSFSISSLHVYDQHWARAEKIGNVKWTPTCTPSPRFNLQGAPNAAVLEKFDMLDGMLRLWFDIEGKIRNGDPCADDVARFPEPMLRSWLRVLQWWWTGDQVWLHSLRGTQIYLSALNGVQPRPGEQDVPRPGPVVGDFADAVKKTNMSPFSVYVADLHATKHEAYGDSWKRRGEKVGIQANVARKVDRLGKTDDLETAADTAIDLLVYLLKYRWWLFDKGRAGGPVSTSPADRADEVTRVELFLQRLDVQPGWMSSRDYVGELQAAFEALLEDDGGLTVTYVNRLIDLANAYARKEYWAANNAKRSWAGYGE